MLNPSADFSNDLRWQAIKRDVKERDGYKCRLCKGTEGLNVAHIFARRRFPELKYAMNNMVLLCNLCNFRHGARLMKFEQFRNQLHGTVS